MASLEFLGVGEALDGENLNSSYLLRCSSVLLVDCGFAIPPVLLTRQFDPNYIDALYLTHFHADHIFGVPIFILDLKLRGRTKELVIIGQPGTERRIDTLCGFAYQTVLKELPFKIRYLETVAPTRWNEFSLSFARTIHSLANYAIRIDHREFSLGISGDGDLTEDSRALFEPCTTLIHETFLAKQEFPNHASAQGVLAYASRLKNLKQLAFVHLNAKARREGFAEFQALAQESSLPAIIPIPGTLIDL